MTHDPMQTYAMQTYAALSGYPGVASQFGVPHQGLPTLGIQPGISPLLQGGGISPFAPGVGISPLQNPVLQNPILQHALLQNPLVGGLQNPLLQQQNPLQHPQQNPLLQHAIQAQIQAQLAQQLVAQQLAQQLGQQPFAGHGQQIFPFGQTGSPYGQVSPFAQMGVPWAQGISPLAPQTWIGQGGQMGGYGQGLYGQGIYGQGVYGQINPLAHLGSRGPWGGI